MSFLDKIKDENHHGKLPGQERESLSSKDVLTIINKLLEKKDLNYSLFFGAIEERLSLNFDGAMDFIQNKIQDNYNGDYSPKNIEEIINNFEHLYKEKVAREKEGNQQALNEALGETSDHFSKMADDIINGQKKIDKYMSEKELIDKWEKFIKGSVNFVIEQIAVKREISTNLNDALFSINDFLVKIKDMDFMKKEENLIKKLNNALMSLPELVKGESNKNQEIKGIWDEIEQESRKEAVKNLILKIKEQFDPENSLNMFKKSFSEIIKNIEEKN